MARGGAVQMARLAAELKRRGHEVTCAVHRAPNHRRPLEHDFAALFEAGLTVIPFNQDRLLEIPRMRKWIRAQRFDVIHAHRDKALGMAHRATWGMNDLPLFTNRGTTLPIGRRHGARRAFRSPRLRAVLAVAEAVKRSLIEQDGIPAEKIIVVYGSVDTEVFHPGVDGSSIRTEIGLDAETPLIGLPAALVPKKGHDDFLKMMPRVLSEVPNAHFAWIGEGSAEKIAEVTQGCEHLDRLHHLGLRTDMPQVMAALSIVTCCSTHGEGLTGTLREALAMARPVVTTDVSGNSEIVRPGETGQVVPIGDPEAMAKAIVWTLQHPDEARRFAEAGRQWVEANCSESVRADRVEQIYLREIDRGRCLDG